MTFLLKSGPRYGSGRVKKIRHESMPRTLFIHAAHRSDVKTISGTTLTVLRVPDYGYQEIKTKCANTL